LAFGLYLTTGLFGAPLGEWDAFFPPYGNHEKMASRSGAPELSWTSDYEAARVESRVTGKPIFIDFTGYACTNCRWMEANIFPKPDVHALLAQYVRVQLYTDGRGDEHKRNREFQESQFGTVALPFYAIVAPDGQTIAQFPGMTRDKTLFVKFLDKGANGHVKPSVSTGIK
jgi:thiol:disulfide interchange protein DsbD